MRSTLQQERTGNLILHAVKAHESMLGVRTLMLILKGSKEKRIMERKLHESSFFGALFYYSQDSIQHFIQQLLEQGYLKKVIKQSFPYPVLFLMLTERGIFALQNNEDPVLEKRSTPPPTELNASEEETLALFQQLKNIALIAQQRELAESTIWSHLERTIKLGKISVEKVVEENRKKVIVEAKEKLGFVRMKELKEVLPPQISYGEIRCVLVRNI